MKFLKVCSVFVMMAFFSAFSWAAGDIAGYEPGDGKGDGKPPTVFTCQTAQDGVVLTIENLVLVRLEREGQLPGGRVDKNHAGVKVSVLRYEDSPETFKGTISAMPLGKDWPGKGPNIEGLDISRNIGSAPVSGNRVSIRVSVKQGAEFQPINLVFEGSIGRAWAGVVGEGYQAKNRNGDPLLLIGARCQQPTPEALSTMAGRL